MAFACKSETYRSLNSRVKKVHWSTGKNIFKYFPQFTVAKLAQTLGREVLDPSQYVIILLKYLGAIPYVSLLGQCCKVVAFRKTSIACIVSSVFFQRKHSYNVQIGSNELFIAIAVSTDRCATLRLQEKELITELE